VTRRVLLLLAAVAALGGACGTSTVSSPAIPTQATAPQVMPSGAEQVADTPAASSADQSCNGGHPTASLAPQAALPVPGQMPAGSYMATIRNRGYLLAGVDQNTLLWGYRNAAGQLAGFDIDMVDQVAHAIFGSAWAQHIRYVIVPNADRIPAVASGQVDIVAETMTITCSRQYLAPGQKADPAACCVDFSAEYYDAAQRVLVPDGSPIHSLADLAGERVCAAQGSTSLVNLTKDAPAAKQVQVVNQTDCLVLLQQGQVDAISTDDTILEGLAAQDPNLELVPNVRLSNEPYGMAISKAHPDFTRFVNSVLAEERADGQWAATWTQFLGPVLHTVAPSPPAPVYRD
jgi:polar amino acid transport system substrate-binding protein